MTRPEFINKMQEVSEKNGNKLSKSTCDYIVWLFTESIKQALSENESVKLVGFGKFYVKEDKATRRKMPNGDIIEVPAQRKAAFKVGEELKKIIPQSE